VHAAMRITSMLRWLTNSVTDRLTGSSCTRACVPAPSEV
jgi:hypothetical protein